MKFSDKEEKTEWRGAHYSAGGQSVFYCFIIDANFQAGEQLF